MRRNLLGIVTCATMIILMLVTQAQAKSSNNSSNFNSKKSHLKSEYKAYSQTLSKAKNYMEDKKVYRQGLYDYNPRQGIKNINAEQKKVHNGLKSIKIERNLAVQNLENRLATATNEKQKKILTNQINTINNDYQKFRNTIAPDLSQFKSSYQETHSDLRERMH